MRRRYPVKLYVNGRRVTEVLIDPHYEIRHSDTMTDDLILELAAKLSGLSFLPVASDSEGFEYFKTEPLWLDQSAYRLVWLTHPDESFIGVRNAFKTKKWRKK